MSAFWNYFWKREGNFKNIWITLIKLILVICYFTKEACDRNFYGALGSSQWMPRVEWVVTKASTLHTQQVPHELRTRNCVFDTSNYNVYRYVIISIFKAPGICCNSHCSKYEVNFAHRHICKICIFPLLTFFHFCYFSDSLVFFSGWFLCLLMLILFCLFWTQYYIEEEDMFI